MLDAKISKDRVPDVYRRIAPVYDVWAWLTERDARDRCLKLAAIRDGESVLEVAVGTGGNTWGEINSPAHWGETSWLASVGAPGSAWPLGWFPRLEQLN